ncbi:hypothetical protein GGD41_004183 [Paraburkholderia bryophila]|uniref:Uncharacterized protein n=1 Tax=Paraburkholderia bryophila TaxID=420952 RepID=A0A7Z0B1U6_9BURK|nr:hypothetical protein [Paraburkholderia bryophila]
MSHASRIFSWLVPESVTIRRPAHVLRLLQRRDLAVGLHVKANLVLTVAGKIEFELALLRDRDVRQHRVDLAGLQRERPVGPRHRHQFQLSTQTIRDHLREVGVETDHGFRVGGIRADRRDGRMNADCERVVFHEMKLRGDGFHGHRIFLHTDPVRLLWAEIERNAG